MTTEQKAKAYDKAFERAKECHIDGLSLHQPVKDVIEHIFPELKESEDEKIRKVLVDMFKGYNIQKVGDFTDKEIIAWLEKQNEQKVPVACFKAKDWYVSKVDGKIRNIYHSVDKVEPKFKVGDWITNGVTKPAQISSIEDDMYYTHNGTIGGDIESIDKDYHLWTIADAKDGDVLVASDKSLFIYDGSINENGSVGFHIAFTEDMDIILNSDDGCGWEEKDSCHPATKKQYDTLIKAMTDAGYTFDFEKKELKKIEQNPTWDEDDEYYMSECIGAIATKDGWSFEEKRKTKHWLKSLKQRYTWKPNDKQMNALDSTLQYSQVSYNSSEHLNSLFNDLKKLREEEL